MRKVRIPLIALLLALTLVAIGCSSGRLSNITTTGASVSPQTTVHAMSATSSETTAEPTPSEPADTRTIEIGGQEYTYAEILKDSSYAELYAPENGPDLSSLPDLFEKIGYQAISEQEDTLTLASEESGARVLITTYNNSSDTHKELYRYIVQSIGKNKYLEQTFQLFLYVDLENTYLSVTHFVMSGEGNHFILYYQSGAQVVRAELPENTHTIDIFMQVMQQFRLSRADLDYSNEQH